MPTARGPIPGQGANTSTWKRDVSRAIRQRNAKEKPYKHQQFAYCAIAVLSPNDGVFTASSIHGDELRGRRYDICQNKPIRMHWQS